MNTNSTLAIRYNDASVLENHHASCGFLLLDRAGLLRNLPAHDFRALRKAMLAAIIATDMSAHRALLNRVTARVDAAEAAFAAGGLAAAGSLKASDSPSRQSEDMTPRLDRRLSLGPRASVSAAAANAVFAAAADTCIGFSAGSAEERELLVAFLLHCADLCNPLLPPEMSQRIAAALGREFEAQAVCRELASRFPHPAD